MEERTAAEVLSGIMDQEDTYEQRVKRLKEAEERKQKRFNFSRSGFRYNIDQSSSVTGKVNVRLEDGRVKVRGANIEYKKEF